MPLPEPKLEVHSQHAEEIKHTDITIHTDVCQIYSDATTVGRREKTVERLRENIQNSTRVHDAKDFILHRGYAQCDDEDEAGQPFVWLIVITLTRAKLFTDGDMRKLLGVEDVEPDEDE